MYFVCLKISVIKNVFFHRREGEGTEVTSAPVLLVENFHTSYSYRQELVTLLLESGFGQSEAFYPVENV